MAFESDRVHLSVLTPDLGEGEDEFRFTLSREEFLELFFEDLELPDLIKTDGNRIIVVQYDRLHHIDVSGEQAVLTDTIHLENHWSSDLLLVGDRVLVLAGTEPPYGPVTLDGSENPLSRLVPPGRWSQLTSIIEVDLSDPGNLVVANTLTVEGRYVSARVVNGAARVVITSPMDDLPFVYPAGPAGEERAERVNREVIAETTVDDWVPGFVHEAADGTVTDGRLVDCTDISHPVEFSGFSTLSVLTVDLGAPLGAPRATAVLADGQTLSQGSGVYEIVPGFILSWLAIWLVSMMGKPPSEDIQSTFEAVRQALHRKGEPETPR